MGQSSTLNLLSISTIPTNEKADLRKEENELCISISAIL